MINHKHKKAFSMITAIFVIVIMASITLLIMNVTGKTIKSTTEQYQKEQAQLLARSYTELAILYVLNYDRFAGAGTPCLQTITDHFGAAYPNGYDIEINIKYIGNNTLIPATCASYLTPAWNASASLSAFDNTVSLIIDTYIKYNVIDHPLNENASTADDVFYTFHRRTLQKL